MNGRSAPPTEPFFAVAMPAYNAAATLRQAVDSVLAQTFPAWELVIVNDGSRDDTGRLAHALAEADARITVIDQENAGCGAARDVAIRRTKAPGIVHFDADDELAPDCLETYRRLVGEHPQHAIFSSDAALFGEARVAGRLYSDVNFPGQHRFHQESEFLLPEMLQRCLIVSAGAVFSRDAYERAGGIRLEAHTEDYDLWLRAMATGARHWYTPRVLVRYRVSSSQMIAARDRIYDGSAEALRHLAGLGLLDNDLSRLALRSAHRNELLAERVRLEERLVRGDTSGARREFYRLRSTFRSPARWLLLAPVVCVDPRIWARRVARRSCTRQPGEQD